jgi:hypothetical protein
MGPEASLAVLGFVDSYSDPVRRLPIFQSAIEGKDLRTMCNTVWSKVVSSHNLFYK